MGFSSLKMTLISTEFGGSKLLSLWYPRGFCCKEEIQAARLLKGRSQHSNVGAKLVRFIFFPQETILKTRKPVFLQQETQLQANTSTSAVRAFL